MKQVITAVSDIFNRLYYSDKSSHDSCVPTEKILVSQFMSYQTYKYGPVTNNQHSIQASVEIDWAPPINICEGHNCPLTDEVMLCKFLHGFQDTETFVSHVC
ncbi:hypothetical protein QE152_g11031 [Popillia japonica]|uniref:Uncharacterized protein n=1 Tax=Popillia japonica TaxID=7064 RepID=A0AAW1LSS5_POPJA